ncbi:MAG: metallophosphoesterase family protein [Planctomycetota bacterium]
MPQLLLFSDLHCDVGAAERLVQRAQDESIDILVGAGDFGICRERTELVINVLRQSELPAVMVPGNAESVQELRAACAGWENCHALHGSGTEINGIPFWGVGGGIPVTPFGSWSYDFDEATAQQMLADCPSEGVLVLHSPPLDCCDADSRGVVRGSAAIRQCIERCVPKLAVCGHIHSSWERIERIGDTTVIKAGPRGMIFSLPGG